VRRRGALTPYLFLLPGFALFAAFRLYRSSTAFGCPSRIDGAGPWRIFTSIVLPLSQPVLGALAIFAFRSAWNDFLWPLIAVNKPEMFPLPVALALLRSAYSSES
jgi:ABC-type maltose transport system permease subunit